MRVHNICRSPSEPPATATRREKKEKSFFDFREKAIINENRVFFFPLRVFSPLSRPLSLIFSAARVCVHVYTLYDRRRALSPNFIPFVPIATILLFFGPRVYACRAYASLLGQSFTTTVRRVLAPSSTLRATFESTNSLSKVYHSTVYGYAYCSIYNTRSFTSLTLTHLRGDITPSFFLRLGVFLPRSIRSDFISKLFFISFLLSYSFSVYFLPSIKFILFIPSFWKFQMSITYLAFGSIPDYFHRNQIHSQFLEWFFALHSIHSISESPFRGFSMCNMIHLIETNLNKTIPKDFLSECKEEITNLMVPLFCNQEKFTNPSLHFIFIW